MSDFLFSKDGTAQGVAKQRLIESLAKPDKRIIYDPYADAFVTGSGLIKLMGHKLNVWLTQKFVPGFHGHLICRTRFIDDLIEKSAINGVEQYVILGAGYDSRAHRLNLPSTLKIFEVDQPEVQRKKRAKLPEIIKGSENITYVSVDFSHTTLKMQLLHAGFNISKPTVFTLEGVSQYITKEAMKATLEDISNLVKTTKSTFYLSYVDQQINTHPENCFGKGYANAKKKVETIKRLSATVGEPWISFYSKLEIENTLSQYGFEVITHKTLADLNNVYFGPVGRTLPQDNIFNLEHFIVAQKNND